MANAVAGALVDLTSKQESEWARWQREWAEKLWANPHALDYIRNDLYAR